MAQFPPVDMPSDDPGLKAAKLFQEAFGAKFAEQLAPRRVKSILFGPAPDGTFICAAIGLMTGETFDFSFSSEEAEGIGGALGLAWRSAAELRTLQGAAKGKA